jgi:hypothetical protein
MSRLEAAPTDKFVNGNLGFPDNQIFFYLRFVLALFRIWWDVKAALIFWLLIDI